MKSYSAINNTTHSALSLWFSSIRKQAHTHSQSPGHANRPDENSTVSFHRDLSRINTQQFLPRGLIIPGEYDETSCNMVSHFFPRNSRYLFKIKQDVQWWPQVLGFTHFIPKTLAAPSIAAHDCMYTFIYTHNSLNLWYKIYNPTMYLLSSYLNTLNCCTGIL